MSDTEWEEVVVREGHVSSGGLGEDMGNDKVSWMHDWEDMAVKLI